MADDPGKVIVPFDTKRVSPSRIGTYADCGLQFKFKYVDGITPERQGSAALFGKVMHRARESWVLDRSKNLIALTEGAWLVETQDDPIVAAFLSEYQALSKKAIRVEEEIRRRRPELKAVRMSKDWRQAPISRQVNQLCASWDKRLAASKYDFDERNPLPALYDESLTLAWKYSVKYRNLPHAYLTEFPFDFEWNGYRLNGFIDEITVLLDKDTGERLGVGIVDAKTYRYLPDHDFKDWRQGMIYTLAFREYASRGVFDFDTSGRCFFGIDRMRHLNEPDAFQWFEFGEKEERRLLFELRMYERGVQNEVFVPASKTCKADYCDFASTCAFHHGNASEPVVLNVA